MEKMVILRSLYRSVCSRSYSVAAIRNSVIHHHQSAAQSFFNSSISARPAISNSPRRAPSDLSSPLFAGIRSVRYFSDDISRMPEFKDPALQRAFKDLMAASWDELPPALIHELKEALSETDGDKSGKEVVENVFRAAEAVEEFSGKLVNLKMEIDDSVGLSGEDVKPLPQELVNALRTAYDRYTAYLAAFGDDEGYLKKKVETELGTKMIHLKMRCGGLGAQWGKVSVLGTSGLSGSYVEQRS